MMPEQAKVKGRVAVLGVDDFHRALHREWSRGERIALPVSLVVIEAAGGSDRGRHGREAERILQRMLDVLAERIRCTDVLGWHEPGKLGVLLPHTTGANAWLLMADVQAQAERVLGGPEELKRLEVKVYASS